MVVSLRNARFEVVEYDEFKFATKSLDRVCRELGYRDTVTCVIMNPILSIKLFTAYISAMIEDYIIRTLKNPLPLEPAEPYPQAEDEDNVRWGE